MSDLTPVILLLTVFVDFPFFLERKNHKYKDRSEGK